MDTKALFAPLLSTLDRLCNGFVVKDFAGFLNWESNIGALLLPYTGHHSEFCASVKQNADVYANCARCSRVHERLCKRSFQPFSKPCHLGLEEYSVPIVINGSCIGSISAGLYCPDPARTAERVETLCNQFGFDQPAMTQHLNRSIFASGPSEASKAAVNFMAAYLSELLSPYFDRTMESREIMSAADVGFIDIQNCIYRRFTNSNISVATIARDCNYSPSYVSHIFSQRMGINLRTYINQLRIVLAKHELTNGRNVSMTAMVCGFNDANYFSRVFQELVGIPPSLYARHAKNPNAKGHAVPTIDTLLSIDPMTDFSSLKEE